MRSLFLIILIFISIVSPAQQPKARIKSALSEAEKNYLHALSILKNTSHNALSKELALEALEYADKAIKSDSTKSNYFRARGTAYYHLKNYEAALENFDEATRLDPANSLAWMNKGIVFENTGRYELAEENYLKAKQYDPNSAVVYFNFGMLYDRWNKPELSLKYYDTAIHYGDISAYTNRGELKLRMKRYEEAIKDFDYAIYRDSTDKISFNNRGLCKLYLKYYKNAIIDFEKALSINLGSSFDQNFNTDKYSYNNMANSYFGLGNIEQACKYWKIAVEKGYTYKPEWKVIYGIDDPKELIKKYCQ